MPMLFGQRPCSYWHARHSQHRHRSASIYQITHFGILQIRVYALRAIVTRSVDLKSVFTDEYKVFLQRLVSARRKAGLTQQELASRLNKPQSFVSKFERRERRLDVLEFIIICRALDVDACGIIREVEDSLFRESIPREQA